MSEPEIIRCLADCVAAYNRGALAEAERRCREVLAVDPRHAEALNLLGAVYLQRGEPDAAGEVFRQIIEVKPDFAMAYCNLGMSLDRSQCLAEAEACYRQALLLSADLAQAHSNLGILLHKTGRLPEAQVCYREATALQPEQAHYHFNLGNFLAESGNLHEAEQCYRQALSLNPRYVEAYNNLGVMLDNMGRILEAQTCCREALALSPGYADAHRNLGTLLYKDRRLDEAEACLRQALKLQPDFVAAHNTLGVLLYETQRLREACACYRRALELQPGYRPAQFNLGLVLLKMGQFDEAWLLHESRYMDSPYWAKDERQAQRPGLPFPQWQGESLQGKSLLVWPEQGLGDCIQFARFFPLLKARGLSRLTVASPPGLRTLFESMDGVDAWTSPDDVVEIAAHDYWCFYMSLPLHFAVTLETIPASLPYLSVAPGRVEYWRERLPRGTRVGLVWAGEPRPGCPGLNAIDRRRSLHVKSYLPLLGLSGITFVSLQKGACARAQLAEVPAEQRPLDLMDEVHDFADTAAIIENLDLVITVDTSVAHLAGALNRPVWILSRFDGCWRWLEGRDDSPWYPGVARLFRQAQPGEWAPVVARVAWELSKGEVFVASTEK